MQAAFKYLNAVEPELCKKFGYDNMAKLKKKYKSLQQRYGTIAKARSRSAGGVKVFDTGAAEEVVSVARIADQGDDEA